MKRFVVGFVSFFDNEVKLEVVEAATPEDAMRRSSFLQGYEFPAGAPVEMIQHEMFSCDASISVIEV